LIGAPAPLGHQGPGTVACPNQITRRITAGRTVTFGAVCTTAHYNYTAPPQRPAEAWPCTAALNLRRLLNLGLHHRNGAWTIPTTAA
jgi:hypothetical protein